MAGSRSASDLVPSWLEADLPRLVSNSGQVVAWTRLLTRFRERAGDTSGFDFPGAQPVFVLYTLQEAAQALQVFGVLTTTPAELPGVETFQSLEVKDRRRVFQSWTLWAEQAAEVIEHTPIPDAEWAPVLEVLDSELLARLVGVSLASLRRYSSGERPTPQDVAERLHTIALIVADLTGSYNEYGIRRWFARPRSQLGNRAPVDVLAGGWSPDDTDVAAVRSLASALLSLGAT